MLVDFRILGRLGVIESLEDLDVSAPRWILCTRDFCRAMPITAEVSGHGWFESYPPENAVDGNRFSSFVTNARAEWAELTIDTETLARKRLIALEWPLEERLTISKVEAGQSLAGPWNEITAVSGLNSSERHGLWQLGAKGARVQEETVLSRVSEVKYRLSVLPEGEQEDADFWVGGQILSVDGPCAGMVRRILGWTLESPAPSPPAEPYGEITIDWPWPSDLTVGRQVRLQLDRGGYLGSRFLRIRVARLCNAGLLPISLSGLSVFDYFMQLKGDLGRFRSVRAGNPSDIGRSSEQGVVHDCFSGMEPEQWGGPRRRLDVRWSVAHEGFGDWLEWWKGLGLVGLVDEEWRYMQIIMGEGSLSWSKLPLDRDGRSAIAVVAVMQES